MYSEKGYYLISCQIGIEIPMVTGSLACHNTDPEFTITSSPIFRHFYQVNFSRQNIVNRKDEVGLDVRFSGGQKIHMQMRIWKRLVWWSMAFRLSDTGHFHGKEQTSNIMK